MKNFSINDLWNFFFYWRATKEITKRWMLNNDDDHNKFKSMLHCNVKSTGVFFFKNKVIARCSGDKWHLVFTLKHHVTLFYLHKNQSIKVDFCLYLPILLILYKCWYNHYNWDSHWLCLHFLDKVHIYAVCVIYK